MEHHPQFKGVVCERSRLSMQDSVPIQECLERCSRRPGRPCSFTRPLLLKMVESSREFAFSPSLLNSCLKRIWFDVKRPADRVFYPERLWSALRGTLIHTGLEQLDDDPTIRVVKEQRIATQIVVNGQTIEFTGKPDLIELTRRAGDWAGLLIDWKTTSTVVTAPKSDHVMQLSLYRWLIERALVVDDLPVKIDAAELFYIHDKEALRFRSSEDFDLLTYEEAEEYVKERVAEILAVLASDEPPEGWSKTWLCGWCPYQRLCYGRDF